MAPAVPASDLLDLAVAAATEAATFLDHHLHDERTTVTSKSSATDMVTEMDRAAERLLVERILAARPDDAIVGEEGADHPGSSGVRWIVDPLDGTTNYLYRLPGWNVSVGVEVDGEPIAGAVVVPGFGDVFAARSGGGATRNAGPVGVSTPVSLATALVGTGFAYVPETRAQQAQVLTELLPRVRDIRRIGAAAGDLCSVACGRIDAYVESGLAPWDRAAGAVIAREAGARVEVFEDTPFPGELTVAANPMIWDELLDVLQASGALRG